MNKKSLLKPDPSAVMVSCRRRLTIEMWIEEIITIITILTVPPNDQCLCHPKHKRSSVNFISFTFRNNTILFIPILFFRV